MNAIEAVVFLIFSWHFRWWWVVALDVLPSKALVALYRVAVVVRVRADACDFTIVIFYRRFDKGSHISNRRMVRRPRGHRH